MTYILVYDDNGNEAVGALYNQWNYESIQAHKIIRFEKQLAKWKKNKITFPTDYDRWITMYNYIASISDQTMHNDFRDELKHYDSGCGMYDEDNNNGWQFVVIKIDHNDCNHKPIQVNYGFRRNKYFKNKNGQYKLVKGFVNLYKNVLHEDLSSKDEFKIRKIENYLKKFNKTDQKILEKINNSFDEKIIKFAEERIQNFIDNKRRII
jgi:hypothetical protein